MEQASRKDLRPLSKELLEIDRASDKRHKHRIELGVFGGVQPPVGQIVFQVFVSVECSFAHPGARAEQGGPDEPLGGAPVASFWRSKDGLSRGQGN
jgi:hypothetical protein